MSKKGIQVGMTVVVTAIAILIGAVVLFGFTANVTKTLEKDKDRTICRASLISQSMAGKALSPDLINIDCKTFNVNFFENKVEINEKTVNVLDPSTSKNSKSFDSLNEGIVNYVLAEELRKCWWQMLEGKTSILSFSYTGIDYNRYCFICDEIYFDSSVKKPEFKGFFQYTKETAMPGSDLTYYQYYAESGHRAIPRLYDKDPNKNAWEEYSEGMFKLFREDRNPVAKDINFTKDGKYVIFMVKEGTTEKYLTTATKISSGLGDPDAIVETYFAYVLPVSELANQCTNVKRGR